MTQPQALEPVPPVQQPGSAPVVLRILLAILLGLPGILGIAVIGVAAGIWISEGFTFLSGDRDFVPLFVLPAVCLVVFSAVCIGVILRFARWRQAPCASLVLAIVAGIAIVISYQLVTDAINVDDTDSRQMLLAGAIVALVVACLPPLLHWWSAPPKAKPTAN